MPKKNPESKLKPRAAIIYASKNNGPGRTSVYLSGRPGEVQRIFVRAVAVIGDSVDALMRSKPDRDETLLNTVDL